MSTLTPEHIKSKSAFKESFPHWSA